MIPHKSGLSQSAAPEYQPRWRIRHLLGGQASPPDVCILCISPLHPTVTSTPVTTPFKLVAVGIQVLTHYGCWYCIIPYCRYEGRSGYYHEDVLL